MALLYPISNYEEDLPGYKPPMPPQQQAAPAPAKAKKRKMSPWAIAGLGLLAGLWNEENPQGFDAAARNFRAGLLERARMALEQQKRKDELDWQAQQAKRWEEDRLSREDIAADTIQARQEASEAANRIRQMLATGYDPVTGMPVKYGEGTAGWANIQKALADERDRALKWGRAFGVDPETGEPMPAVPGSQQWLDLKRGAYIGGPQTEAEKARARLMLEGQLPLAKERAAGQRAANAITSAPEYQRSMIRKPGLLNNLTQMRISTEGYRPEYMRGLLDVARQNANTNSQWAGVRAYSGAGLTPVPPGYVPPATPGPNDEMLTPFTLPGVPEQQWVPDAALKQGKTGQTVQDSSVEKTLVGIARQLGVTVTPENRTAVIATTRNLMNKGALRYPTKSEVDPLGSPMDPTPITSLPIKTVDANAINKAYAPFRAKSPSKPKKAAAGPGVPPDVAEDARKALQLGKTWNDVSAALEKMGYSHARRLMLRQYLGAR